MQICIIKKWHNLLKSDAYVLLAKIKSWKDNF